MRRRGQLLDNGPETLSVQRRRSVEDTTRGGTRLVDDGPPVLVRGAAVEPATTDEIDAFGLEPFTSYRVICRGPWPGDLHARISWDGAEYDQRGQARRHRRGSRRTHHVVVLITQRGAEVRR